MRALLGALALGVAGAAHAQTVSFAVPEAPAFTFLGVNPTKIARPGTTRDLAVAILTGVDSSGRAIGTIAAAKTLSYGARANYGGGSANLFFELLGVRRFDAPTGVDGATGTWSAGVEFRAAENLWLSTGLGATFADATKGDRVLIIAGVRWAVADGARFVDER